MEAHMKDRPLRRGCCSTTPKSHVVRLGELRVAGGLQLNGELWPSALGDTPIDKDMNPVRMEFVEQALEMRNGQDSEAPLFCGTFDSAGHCTKSVNVETRVNLIEDCEQRLQGGQLNNFSSLGFPSRKVHVQRTLEKVGAQANSGSLFHHSCF